MDFSKRFTSLFSKKIIYHLLFWIGILLIEIATLVEEIISGHVEHWALWHHLFKLLFTLMASYLNYLVFIPLFFKKKRYVSFGFFNIINLVIFSFLVFGSTITIYSEKSIHISEGIEHHIVFTSSILYVLFFIILSTLISLGQEWYKLKDISHKLIQIEKEKIESEHNTLKAQLNPHFLFNTLNNIYALSLSKSDKTSEVVIKLSNLMSYILYECKEDFVILKKEISFINDYIDLEKIRSKKLKIEYKTSVNKEDLKIAPLLFIPFVENAFKHSNKDNEGSFVKIALILNETEDLYFTCENTKNNGKALIEKMYKGFGLENVKKRLTLLYPEKHKLCIFDEIETYKVELSIRL